MLYIYYNLEGNVQLSQVDHKNNYCFPIYGCYRDQRSKSCTPTVDVHVKLMRISFSLVKVFWDFSFTDLRDV